MKKFSSHTFEYVVFQYVVRSNIKFLLYDLKHYMSAKQLSNFVNL